VRDRAFDGGEPGEEPAQRGVGGRCRVGDHRGQPAVLGERVQQDRAAAGQPVCHGVRAGGHGRRQVGERAPRPVPGQRRQVYPVPARPVGEVSGKRRGARRNLAFAVHEQHGGSLDPGRHVGQAPQGQRVGVVRVVDHEHQRPVRGYREHGPAQVVQQVGGDHVGDRGAERVVE